MIKIFKLILLLFLCSCDIGSRYMTVVNKDGKKVYIKRQIPEFNQKYLKNQDNRYKYNDNFSEKSEINTELTNKITNNSNNNDIKKILNSSAYSEESVLERNQKIYKQIQENNEIKKNIIEEKEKVENDFKTITDFDYLPSYLFEDPKPEEQKTIFNITINKNKEYNNVVENQESPWTKFKNFFTPKNNNTASYSSKNNEEKIVEQLQKDKQKEIFSEKSLVNNRDELNIVNLEDKKNIEIKNFDKKDKKSDVNYGSIENYKVSSYELEVQESSWTKFKNFFKPILPNKDKNVAKSEIKINEEKIAKQLQKDKEKEIFSEESLVNTKNELNIVNLEDKKNIEIKNFDKKDKKSDVNYGSIENYNSNNYELENQESTWTKFKNFFTLNKNESKIKNEEKNINGNYSLTENKDDVYFNNKIEKKDNLTNNLEINSFENKDNLTNNLEINSFENKNIEKKGKDSFAIKIKDEKKKKKEVTIISNKNMLKKGKYYLQLGSVKNKSDAENLLNKYKSIATPGFILKVSIENSVYYRIILGGFNEYKLASLEKEKIINFGHYDVYIFKE